MADFTEETNLRDVIVNADGSVKVAYNYTLKKGEEVVVTDVHYTDYPAGATMTEDVYNLLAVAASHPATRSDT
jgi:hypothetical protein